MAVPRDALTCRHIWANLTRFQPGYAHMYQDLTKFRFLAVNSVLVKPSKLAYSSLNDKLAALERAFSPWTAAHRGEKALMRLLRDVPELAEPLLWLAAARGDKFLLETIGKCVGKLEKRHCEAEWIPVAMAAMHGHVEVLESLEKMQLGRFTDSAMDMAAQHGHLHCVKFMCRNGQVPKTNALDVAAGAGHMEVVVYLRAEFPELAFTHKAMDQAAQGNRVEMVAYLLAENAPSTGVAFDAASCLGWFDVVEKLLKAGRRRHDAFAIDLAASNGHLDIVKLLHENQSTWTDNAITMAKKNGHDAVVAYLMAHTQTPCSNGDEVA